MATHTFRTQALGFSFVSKNFSSLEDFMRSLPDYKAEEKPSEKIVEVEIAKHVKHVKRVERSRQTKHTRTMLTEEERQISKKKRERLREFYKRQRAEREKERRLIDAQRAARQRAREDLDDAVYLSHLAGRGCSSLYASNEYMRQYSKGHISDTKDEYMRQCSKDFTN